MTDCECNVPGVYLCVKAYGDVPLTYSLRASLSKCPGDFTDAGESVECSSLVNSSDKRFTGCNDDGTCQCKAPYQKPLATTYSGGYPACEPGD